MKHLLRSLLLLLLAPSGWAQSANPSMWCPAGATWTYQYGDLSSTGTLMVRYVRDTVVAGQVAQLLVRRISPCYTLGPGACLPGPSYGLSSVVTRVVADRVQVWANGQFYTLFDFAAPPGSSWATPLVTPFGACASAVAQVTVDSTGRQVVGGRSLRWFRVHLTATAGTTATGSWPGRIYELFGNLAQYMQPQSPICHGTDPGFMGPFAGFRATAGPSVGYNAASGGLLASTPRAETGGLVVYPNPSAGAGGLTLQLPPATGKADLAVMDMVGRQVRCQKVTVGDVLDVRNLAAGTYILQLRAPGKAVISQRIVLE